MSEQVFTADGEPCRNKEYHQPGDTWERLDYARMARVVQDVYAVAQDVE